MQPLRPQSRVRCGFMFAGVGVDADGIERSGAYWPCVPGFWTYQWRGMISDGIRILKIRSERYNRAESHRDHHSVSRVASDIVTYFFCLYLAHTLGLEGVSDTFVRHH